MLTMSQLMGLRVYRPQPENRRIRRNGEERPPSKLGKVHQLVFSPDGRHVVGFMVKRPDVAGMVKRADVFLGVDSFRMLERGILATRGDESFDVPARTRLGLDWDACIMWGGMDVRTTDGHEMGYVADVSFDEGTGLLEVIVVTDGSVSTALVGAVEVPAGMLRGYDDGYMVVAPAAEGLSLSGGLAARAGEASAKAKIGGRKAGEKAATAVDRGSYELGRTLGKARRAIREAQEDDPEVAAVPAADVRVAPAKPRERSQAKPGTAGTVKKRTYTPKSVAKGGPTADNGRVQASKGESPSRPLVDADAARKVGRQLGKTKGMFESFKREFDENSR